MLGTQHGHLDITKHAMLNQAWFEPKSFLALMEDSPTLFNLIGQCFQDVGLTEWNNVAGKRCPDNTNLSKSEPGTTRGSHQAFQRRWPTDLLALCCKEACIHVDTWIHATTDTAIQLPQQRLPPLNNGAANSSGEEQIDLPCGPQGASVQV